MRSSVKALDHLPRPSEKRLAIRVTGAAERALRGGHPWLFDRSITSQSHEGRAGDLAVVFDRSRRFLAVGLYDPASPLRVRILQHGQPAAVGRDLFRNRIQAAAELREPLLASETTGYRLVHGENDRLPGLVVDRYDDNYALKLYTTAWVPHLKDLLSALLEITSPTRIVLQMSRAVQNDTTNLYGLRHGQVLFGKALTGPALFCENGLRFEVDLERGQKTGFFLDQRENRARVESLVSQNRTIGRVLNLFAYTGAFALYAARGGVDTVASVDTSRPALAAAERNLALNQDVLGIARVKHKTLVGDVFKILIQLAEQGRDFDMVILDPPSFAKSKDEVGQALKTYGHLTRLGQAVLRPGGVLVYSSCSSQVSNTRFFQAVRQVAVRCGRPLEEIERSAHPLDHPIGFPQGAYLKCLFAIVP